MAIEHVPCTPQVNVWCGLLHDGFVGPNLFAENTVTSTIYMNVLEGFAFPQIEDLQPDIVFQQDGTHPHSAFAVRAVLNEKLPCHWIGRDGPNTWPQ